MWQILFDSRHASCVAGVMIADRIGFAPHSNNFGWSRFSFFAFLKFKPARHIGVTPTFS
jgi:hypothetical protein